MINDSTPNVCQKKCLDEMAVQIRRFCELEGQVDELDWAIFSGLRLLTIVGMRSRLVDGLHGPIFHLHYLQRSEEFPLKTSAV